MAIMFKAAPPFFTLLKVKQGGPNLENQDLKDHFLKKKILSPEIRISSIDVYLFT